MDGKGFWVVSKLDTAEITTRRATFVDEENDAADEGVEDTLVGERGAVSIAEETGVQHERDATGERGTRPLQQEQTDGTETEGAWTPSRKRDRLCSGAGVCGLCLLASAK
ncbi:uncharacterized protein SPSK_02851 [Sporothrix schenckii 1099-18]|uniref:Uncharacterized protein n=1 Tax=Sporothrix schenckii 1099-18 TaxID=1397361 RepID=A0A0F2MDD5_SPOSC|nr:uncharacterized protein SPSK_02851 [Sporothrix schenckii 1099-18]KJR86146.1 hypothetical protein SPSK_02851 [Sporothrix schenckii 1099-18]